MPIRPPALDDRGFADLVADMVRRVPAHTPEWTDLRDGDPGRVLIDLFAWMGDTILYRANLIPERQRLAFLRLLGRPLRPAIPARGLVQVSIDDPAASAAIQLPVRQPITKPLPFEFDQALTVLPVEGRAYIKRRPDSTESSNLAGLIADLKDLYGLGQASASAYITTPVFAGGNAELPGRDFVADSIDQCLWLALLAPGPEAALRAGVAHTLGGGSDGRRVALSVGLAPTLSMPQSLEAISARAPIPHLWEIAAAGGDGTAYLPLEVLADGSGGLTRPGVVQLLLPGADDFGVPSNDVLADIKAGLGDRPPRIDDPVTAARLVAWLRLRPQPAAKIASLPLAWLGVNAAPVTQWQALGMQQIGLGTGLSGQQLSLGATNVDVSSLVIAVEEEEGTRVWPLIDEIALAGPGQRACAVDAEAGTVRFGDGLRGAVPAPGRAIQVVAMRSGGGVAGNVPAGTIKAITGPTPNPRLKLNQPLAMNGGAEAETLDAAEQRIPAELRHSGRAVTHADYSDLARATPGIAIGRIEVLDRFKPQQRRSGIPGVVSVMAIPARDGFQKPAPRPDRPMLETLYAWLDARRPLATELYVIAPDYVPVGVSAAVQLVDPTMRDAVLEMVAQVIRMHLWPLGPGGPDGTGWPLGRPLDDRTIEVAIARVPGVREVAPVRLFSRTSSAGAWRAIAPDGAGRVTLPLEAWQLPELAMLAVTVGDSAATSLGADAAGGDGSGGTGIAVPVVPELC
jgi:predicted phage baseplate assembly protein